MIKYEDNRDKVEVASVEIRYANEAGMIRTCEEQMHGYSSFGA